MRHRGNRHLLLEPLLGLAVEGGALFAVVFVAVWLAAITLYGLVVEQWELVRVRREFSYDWVFLYAPLIAIGCGTALVLVAARRFMRERG